MPPILLDPTDPSYGMKQKADFTREQSDLASESAMDLLNRSMASQREISPTQGIAAALLAAIPTLGGYLIGKGVGGTPKLQAGLGLTYDDLAPTGGNVGGLAGSQIGANASKDYTGAIELDNQHKQKVLAAEAQIENDRAQQLSQQANTVENAALQVDSQIAMMPLEMEQYYKQQQFAADQQIRVDAARRDADQKESALPAEVSAPIQQFLQRTAKGDPNAEESLAVIDFSQLNEREMRGVSSAINTGKNLAMSMRKEKQGNIGEVIKRELAESKGLIQQYTSAADGVAKFSSWKDLQAASAAAGFDPEARVAAIRDAVDRAVRKRTGAVAPEPERERMDGWIRGDITLGPAEVANFLMKSAERENNFSYTVHQGALQLGEDPNAPLFSAPGTFGKPAGPARPPEGFENDPGYIAWKASQGVK